MPALNIFESSLKRGKFDESRKLSNGKLLEFSHVFPMDAVFDKPEDVPEEARHLCHRHCPTKCNLVQQAGQESLPYVTHLCSLGGARGGGGGGGGGF